MTCTVCGGIVSKILDLGQREQVTSLGRLIVGQASVYRCELCTHCQTDTTINLAEYYAKDYKTLMHTMEEDDVYKIIDGRIVWRAEHMARTFIRKIDKLINPLNGNKIRFLDFGTGKGLFPKTVMNLNPLLDSYLFDISEDYTLSWEQFRNSNYYSSFTIPSDWHHSFDVVSSIFSMEHVANPLVEFRTIANLLKPGGYLYVVVPNMYSENIFDMVVVDHVQHYSPCSMRAALQQVNLMLVDEDHVSHDQASIYIAQNIIGAAPEAREGDKHKKYLRMQDEVSLSFASMIDKIDQFADSAQGGPIVVVGAGVIGTFVKSILDSRNGIDLFVDSNIHKQSKGWLSLPVISPSALAEYDKRYRPHYIIAHNPKMVPLALEMLPLDIVQDRVLALF
jgi:2-polyprenyl-3-methyl-5-hydroxy-6-metoxy-1,4-benzoquinol methylase